VYARNRTGIGCNGSPDPEFHEHESNTGRILAKATSDMLDE
jgi:hypothetical protein